MVLVSKRGDEFWVLTLHPPGTMDINVLVRMKPEDGLKILDLIQRKPTDTYDDLCVWYADGMF